MAGCKTDFLCTLQIGAKWPWAKWAEIIKLIVHTWWSHLSSLMTTTWAAAAVPGDFCFLLLSLSPNRWQIHKNKTCYSYHEAPTSNDFSYKNTLLNLFRNVMNYRNLWEYMLQVSHVSIIHCHGMHSCIILHTLFFAWKQCILCSALHHKSYLHYYVTLLRDSLCLGTFAQGFITLLPRSSLVITIQDFTKYKSCS